MATKKKQEINIRPHLRIIGDVHGKLGSYVELAKGAEYSIQVGDVSFNYDYLRRNLDSAKHRIVGGNHDNYTEGEPDHFILQPQHFLGDYGMYTIPDFGDIFYMRGGFSIDSDVRTPGIDWWDKEQLTQDKLLKALDYYTRAKPDFVITHECPSSLIRYFTNRPDDRQFPASRTAEALEQMRLAHRPKRWVFGHHHQNKIIDMNGTTFQCLAELSCVDLAKK